VTWDNGVAFGATIVVTNNGAPIAPWTLSWTVPSTQRFVGSWSSSIVQSGTTFTATPADWIRNLATGQPATFGYDVSDAGPRATPTFRLNGRVCAAA
jgi:cellulase/cellobiase CelA1